MKCMSEQAFPMISREVAVFSVVTEERWNIALAKEGEPRAAEERRRDAVAGAERAREGSVIDRACPAGGATLFEERFFCPRQHGYP